MSGSKVDFPKGFVCCTCYERFDKPVRVVPGSFWLELLCWCFILPGLAYTIWRLTSKRSVCPSCASSDLVPASSARGRDIVARVYGGDEAA